MEKEIQRHEARQVQAHEAVGEGKPRAQNPVAATGLTLHKAMMRHGLAIRL